jgi:dipeptidyl aminopeptidase/acylaminoacyl peptidase
MKAKVLCAVAACIFAASAHAETPAHQPPPLEAYGQLPAIEDISLSPLGERMAFIGIAGDRRRLAVASVKGEPVLVSDVGDIKVRNIEWAGDDIIITYTSQTVNLKIWTGFNHEFYAATVFDLKKKAAHVAFSNQKYVQPVFFGNYGIRNVGGRWIGYFSNLTMEDTADGPALVHGNADLYHVDLLKDTIGKSVRDSERDHNWVVGVDGAIVAGSIYDQKSTDWSLQINGKTLLSRKSPLHEIGLAGLGRTPDSILVQDSEGDDTHLIEYSTKTATQTAVLWDDLSLQKLLRSQSGLLLGAVLEGRSEAVFTDPALTERYSAARKAFPGYQFHLISYTDDLKKMIAMTDGGDDPGTYWLVDIGTGGAKPVAYAYPGLHARDVGPTRLYHYKAADGLELDGVLTLPPGSTGKKLPVVVMPHGGPIDVRDQVGFDYWAQAFASRGYAVFQPNYRGSSGKGLDFIRAGYGEWGRKMLSDVADGLGALAKDGVVDPARACIVGGSYGGYAALAGVTIQQGLYRCSVSVGGVSDLTAFLSWQLDRTGAKSTTMRFDHKAMGVGVPGAPSLSSLSPANLASKVTAPVLLIHGTDDTIVPIEQSQKMQAALKAAGKSVDYLVLQGEDHWMSKGQTRTQMVKASIEFVLKNNPPLQP